MKNYFSTEVKRALNECNISATELDINKMLHLYNQIQYNFTRSNKYEYPLYESLKSYISFKDTNAWRLASEVIPQSKVIMFFEPEENDKGFIFEQPSDVVAILNDTFNFPFYLTNESSSYLLTHNKYDFLIGTGEAINWVKKYVIANDIKYSLKD